MERADHRTPRTSYCARPACRAKLATPHADLPSALSFARDAGWLLGFGAVRLPPKPGPAVAVGAAPVLFAAGVCTAFLDFRGALPHRELAGESVWLLLFQAAVWFVVGAFNARFGGRRDADRLS